MKALAFRIRGEHKDAYDLVYVLQNFDGGPAAVAAKLAPLVNEPEALEARTWLAEDFETVDHVGPKRTAEFIHGEPNDEAQADAWGSVRDLLDGLPD